LKLGCTSNYSESEMVGKVSSLSTSNIKKASDSSSSESENRSNDGVGQRVDLKLGCTSNYSESEMVGKVSSLSTSNIEKASDLSSYNIPKCAVDLINKIRDWMKNENTAFVLVDYQFDFVCPHESSLPVAGSDLISLWFPYVLPLFNKIVLTRDWHPKNHSSFNNADKGDKISIWPEHCVQDTKGAQIYDESFIKANMNENAKLYYSNKGEEVDNPGYSAFDTTKPNMTNIIGDNPSNIDLVFGGVAGDFCVYATLNDALERGHRCLLVTCMTRSIDPNVTASKIQNLKDKYKDKIAVI